MLAVHACAASHRSFTWHAGARGITSLPRTSAAVWPLAAESSSRLVASPPRAASHHASAHRGCRCHLACRLRDGWLVGSVRFAWTDGRRFHALPSAHENRIQLARKHAALYTGAACRSRLWSGILPLSRLSLTRILPGAVRAHRSRRLTLRGVTLPASMPRAHCTCARLRARENSIAPRIWAKERGCICHISTLYSAYLTSPLAATRRYPGIYLRATRIAALAALRCRNATCQRTRACRSLSPLTWHMSIILSSCCSPLGEGACRIAAINRGSCGAASAHQRCRWRLGDVASWG